MRVEGDRLLGEIETEKLNNAIKMHYEGSTINYSSQYPLCGITDTKTGDTISPVVHTCWYSHCLYHRRLSDLPV